MFCLRLSDGRARGEGVVMTLSQPGITLTGADESTSIAALRELVTQGGVEIGILLSLSPEGRNRYPGVPWIEKAVEALGPRCAVHICGRAARERFLRGELPWVARSPDRVQINGAVTAQELRAAVRLAAGVVTQVNQRNSDLTHSPEPRHELLVDASGGRGRSPESWRRPATPLNVGFAGGLGADNLEQELPHIAAAATGHWWVDMESKLRSSADLFSIHEAHRCVAIFHQWLLQQPERIL